MSKLTVRSWLLLILVLIMCIILGCESIETKKFQASKSNYGTRIGYEQQSFNGVRLYGPVLGQKHHMNTTLHYNKELSAALSDMSGIFNAVVMVTNHNAYAAIMLDNTGTGTKGVGFYTW